MTKIDYGSLLKGKDLGVARLNDISSLNKFSGEILEILKSLYDNDDPVIQKLGSVMNSIYTHQNNVFLITYRISNHLIKSDTANHGFVSCNDVGHKAMMARGFANGLFKELRKPTTRGFGKNGKAGLYELVHPAFLNPLKALIGEEICKAKKEAFLKWWDEDDATEKTAESATVALDADFIEARRLGRERRKLNTKRR